MLLIACALALSGCANIGDTEQAHDEDPNSTAPLMKLGKNEIALDQYTQAYAAYHQVQVLKPNDPEAAFHLGELMLVRGSPQAAIDEFNIALKTRKDDPGLLNNLGMAPFLSGDYDLPSMFIVLIGPALIQVFKAF